MKKFYSLLIAGITLFPGAIFAQKPVVTVKATIAEFTMDGKPNETGWVSAPKIAIDKPFAGETVVGGSATFQMLYDADNVYVFVDVKDDVVTSDTDADWKGDKVEIYFGLPGYEPGKGAAEDFARQFYVNASQDWVDGNATTHPQWGAYISNWPGVKDRATDGVAFGYNETADGYQFEMQINKSALGNVDFATIDSLGFDFTLADNDVVGAGKGVRNRLVYYNTGDLQYANENWGAMDLATLKFEKSASVPELTVKKATSAITIDGTGTDAAWASVPKTAIDKPFTGETVTGGSATFQMLYDADNLYVFVDVKDDVVTVDNDASWKGDKVEVYFGLPGYEPGKGAAEDLARQFYVTASQDWVDGTETTHPQWGAYISNWPGVKDRATDGVAFEYKETADGYQFEMKINKSALNNIDFATVGSIGFDYSLADNDVVGAGKGVRNRLVYYNDGSLQYKNENWGAMDLATLKFEAMEAPKNLFMVKKAVSAIAIDGTGTDAAWASVPKTAIDKPYNNETVVGGSATFQMLYDTDNVYVFVDVKDDVVTSDTDADWKGDKVEIYFGLPGYEPGKGAAEDFARQFYVNASQDWVDGTATTHPQWGAYISNWPGVKDRATDGVTFGYNETADGYSFEMQINKSALNNIDFATIDSLGFDFTLADNDVVGAGKGVRNRLVYYNTGDLQYKNENWGALDLAGLGFDKSTAVAPFNKTPEQLAWISNDILRFKGYDKAVNAEIYSILGQKVLSVKNVNELNVANLRSGIYLVRVNNGEKAFKVIK